MASITMDLNSPAAERDVAVVGDIHPVLIAEPDPHRCRRARVGINRAVERHSGPARRYSGLVTELGVQQRIGAGCRVPSTAGILWRRAVAGIEAIRDEADRPAADAGRRCGIGGCDARIESRRADANVA